VLRAFDDVPLSAGDSTQVTLKLTRRDVSNWDTASQDWIVGPEEKTVGVGGSSADLKLEAVLS
jgi:beta-glucosidase